LVISHIRVGEAVVATSKRPAARSSLKTAAVLACGRCVWLYSIENPSKEAIGKIENRSWNFLLKLITE
jgi:hypothetical protein